MPKNMNYEIITKMALNVVMEWDSNNPTPTIDKEPFNSHPEVLIS
jgi:hypothetical protein